MLTGWTLANACNQPGRLCTGTIPAPAGQEYDQMRLTDTSDLGCSQYKAEIEKLGFRIAIFPGLARNAAVFAIREAVNVLKRDGNTKAVSNRMVTMKEYNQVLELADVEEWERRYLRT